MSSRPSKEEAASLQYQTEHADPRKAPTVIPYLVLLAAAAFLLLFMAYLMQQRTNQSVEDLNQSVNTIQTFDQLVDSNQELRGQVDRLQAALADSEDQRLLLEEQLRQVKAQVAELQGQLSALTGEGEETPASPAP